MSKKRLSELEENLNTMASVMPDVMGSFKTFKESVMKENKLTSREKILTALGIVTAKQCKDCIVSWVNTAVDAGITFEEIMEVCGVTMLLNGGPGAAYSVLVVETYNELVNEK